MTKIDMQPGDRLGRSRVQLWQCRRDLSWQPLREPDCRKCGKSRLIVGISPEPLLIAHDSTGRHTSGVAEENSRE